MRALLTAFLLALAIPAPSFQAWAAEPRVEILAQGLEHPWAIAFLPDGRALITERPGRVRIFANGALSGPVPGTPEVAARGQGGLLDIALHPDFARNGLVYLSYAAATEGGAATRVARLRFDGARLSELRVLIEAGPASGEGRHFGSRLAFGRDGKLYVTTGDRGDGPRAQRPGDLAGKMLRLNDDGTVPADNPFAGRAGYRPEIYSYGHRNAQGLAVDPRDGTIWATEHGPMGGDELNRILPGRNYGWPVVTHGRNYGLGTPIGEGTSKPGMEDPVHVWLPTSPAASGLAIYDGAAFPAWRGSLLAGMLRERGIFRLELANGRVAREERLAEGQGRIRDVRVGPDGFVYFLTDAREGVFGRIVPLN
jgi:aldose sugar dehydrogenase